MKIKQPQHTKSKSQVKKGVIKKDKLCLTKDTPSPVETGSPKTSDSLPPKLLDDCLDCLDLLQDAKIDSTDFLPQLNLGKSDLHDISNDLSDISEFLQGKFRDDVNGKLPNSDDNNPPRNRDAMNGTFLNDDSNSFQGKYAIFTSFSVFWYLFF